MLVYLYSTTADIFLLFSHIIIAKQTVLHSSHYIACSDRRNVLRKERKFVEIRLRLNNTNFILFTTATHSEANINLDTIRGEAVAAVSTKFLFFCAKLSSC